MADGTTDQYEPFCMTTTVQTGSRQQVPTLDTIENLKESNLVPRASCSKLVPYSYLPQERPVLLDSSFIAVKFPTPVQKLFATQRRHGRHWEYEQVLLGIFGMSFVF